MIPPLKDMRLRSIHRWMKDQQPKRFRQLTQSGGLEAAMEQLDETMIQEFESQEDAVMHRLDREKTWGTQAGTREFQTRRLMIWGEIREQFLPVISEQT